VKIGAVVVATMPLYRAGELRYIIEKARVSLALCDARLRVDLDAACADGPIVKIVEFASDAPGALEAMMKAATDHFDAVPTAADEVALIAFTSGTTGAPKAAMHFHRDLVATCDTYGKHVLQAQPDDLFAGSPPLAFTYGVGGLLLFPLYAGAATLLLEKTSPEELLRAIGEFGVTTIFTAPIAYRAMCALLDRYDVRTLRTCVSAGETLPKLVFEDWLARTNLRILDGIGSTEMLHIFVGSADDDIRPGSTGREVPGYTAAVLDDDGKPAPDGQPGRLAVKGPTGCLYLSDDRQRSYVRNGWNLTGDTYVRDADGYFWYQARSDDMIISGGYNIAGPEIEEVLLSHPDVTECGVVGVPDEARGQIVKAFVILRDGASADETKARELQDLVKRQIAPYKYPRAVEFVTSLPRTNTGKLQRFRLREQAAGEQTEQTGGN
jgi:2-aminobenzoate-CoA ligase